LWSFFLAWIILFPLLFPSACCSRFLFPPQGLPFCQVFVQEEKGLLTFPLFLFFSSSSLRSFFSLPGWPRHSKESPLFPGSCVFLPPSPLCLLDILFFPPPPFLFPSPYQGRSSPFYCFLFSTFSRRKPLESPSEVPPVLLNKIYEDALLPFSPPLFASPFLSPPMTEAGIDVCSSPPVFFTYQPPLLGVNIAFLLFFFSPPSPGNHSLFFPAFMNTTG